MGTRRTRQRMKRRSKHKPERQPKEGSWTAEWGLADRGRAPPPRPPVNKKLLIFHLVRLSILSVRCRHIPAAAEPGQMPVCAKFCLLLDEYRGVLADISISILIQSRKKCHFLYEPWTCLDTLKIPSFFTLSPSH